MSELNLPTGWCLARIADITKKADQRLPESHESFIYVDIGSINRDSKSIESPQHLLGKDAPSRARKVIQQGDVLVSLTRPNLNAVALVPTELDNQIASTGFEVLKPIGVDNRFVFALTRSKDFINAISESVQGALYPAAKSSDVQSYEFLLPPLAEQKIIAEKLDDMLAKVERIKARLERIPQVLKQFRQSVLADAVSGKLTDEWRQNSEFSLSLERYKKATVSFKSKANGLKDIKEVGKWLSCQLGHVISVKSGDGLTAKDMIGDGGIPVYGGNGINGYHDKFNVTEQKVVIGRVGFYCGSVHLTQEKAWITDNALIVDYPEQLFSKDFIFWLLSTINLREDMAATAQPVISGAKIYPIKLLIPPIEEQIEIARRIRELFSFADIVEQKTNFALEKVSGLSQSILAKAFRGELTEQWRLENPELIIGENSAESLLKKILNERELIKKLQKTRADNVKKKTIMHKITKQEINNWVVSRNGAPFTFEQLKTSFNCDYEQLKESLFEALNDDAAFKQYFDEITGAIQFVGVSR